MTETGGITTITTPDASDDRISASVGRALPGFELRIVEPGTGDDMPDGQSGELWVRSRFMLKTYYGMPKHELERSFTPDGWFRTGDLLSRDGEGNYFFRGRIKDMIKVAGENVAAREVEQVLFGHPAVVQVAVVGVPDPVRNEAVVACVETSTPVTEAELIAFCKSRLASFKAPCRVVFMDDWPTTATGKIQKFRLRERVLAEAQTRP
jgi:acyl-CoA synthetase (AMP-forming)/AMP-acid ligase II